MDIPGHDPDLALSRFDDPRAVGPDQANGLFGRIPVGELAGDADHVVLRDPLRDSHDQRHTGVSCLEDRCCCKRWRDEDRRGVCSSLCDGFGDGVEDRDTEMLGASLFRGDSGDDGGAVLDGLFCVEGAVFPRDALDEDSRGLVDEDGGLVVLGLEELGWRGERKRREERR